MNRNDFIKRLGGLTGLLMGIPASIYGNTTGPGSGFFNRNLKRSDRTKNWDGYEPNILESPWGQKVFYDRYTFIDKQKAQWILEGLSYKQIEVRAEELTDKFERGEISLRKGPARLLDGLWLIDVDGQQNTYLFQLYEPG